MDDQFIKNFREILRKFERELFNQNSESCCKGVTLAQCHTLLEIENKKTISVTELACCQSLDKSTISRTVDGLVNSGLVKREIPLENRRMALLSLTEKGKKTCNDINKKNDQYIAENLTILNDKEQKELLRLFEKITNNMVLVRTCKFGKKQNTCSCG
ncbi:MAG: MarR family transcriptional regulator [Bacteroidales bacterium]|nr:MarR family transcriptional regulator [Bacteroidales bacterium]